MARLADLLAFATKANAALAPVQRVVAELPEGTFQHARTLAESLPSEAERRAVAELDRSTRKLRQMVADDHMRTRQTIKVVQLALIRRRRLSGSRSECSGTRTRASRGKPIRRRGSRRGAVATRAGPSPESDLADSERPSPREGAAV
jgi:hypothetical protein